MITKRKYIFYLAAIINLMVYNLLNSYLEKKIDKISKKYNDLERRFHKTTSYPELKFKSDNKPNNIPNSSLSNILERKSIQEKEENIALEDKLSKDSQKKESAKTPIANLNDNQTVDKNDEQITKKSKIKSNFLFSESEKKYFVPVEVKKENVYDIFEAIEIFRNDTDEDIIIGKIISQNPPEKLFDIDFPFPKGKMVRSGGKAIFRISTLPIDYSDYGKIIQTITISTSYVDGERGEDLHFIIVR